MRAFVAIVFTLLASAAAAQSWPTRPVTLLTPFPPGGGTDVTARTFALKLAERLGQNVLVENRGGASGNIGTAQFVKMAPDGHVLLFTAQSPITIADSLDPKLSFDPVRDLMPVALTQWTPVIIVTPGSHAPNSIREFAAHANQNTGKVFFGSPGTGNELHLVAELIKQEAKIDMTHVPYKGSGPALVDLLAGRTQLLVASPSSVRQYLADGRLKAIAALSKQRVPSLPAVPTAAESGYPDLVADAWFGVFAPARTPAHVIERLNREIAQMATDAAYQQQVRALGMEPAALRPKEFEEVIRSYRNLWSGLIRARGITGE
jgi:tripartite-type tricarboxylate transporter receptor subunit TctC